MLILQVLQGTDRGKRFELPVHEPQLIGRSSEALPITDTTVSRRHAELTPDDGIWYLRDLESANGTFVNGTAISERVQLEPGDQIRCGSTLFLFTLTPDEDRRSTAIRLMEERALDVTVEEKLDPNAESMILASPDPVRAASDHLRVIYDLTALTASTLNRSELLERVMELVFDEFRPDRGFILLGADGNAPLDPVVVRYKVRPRTVDEGRIPVSRTIIQHAMEKGEGILSTNAMNDTRFASGDSVRDYGIRSALCVPIAAGTRIFGVVHIDSQMMNFTFTAQQLQLLNAIGQHTGLALLSTELVAEKMHSERLAAIGQTVTSLSHSIKNILQGLRGGADAVELALKKGDTQLAFEGWPILARNLDRIFTLTLNMLAFSRQSSLDIELTDLHALIAEAEELIGRQCHRKDVGLIVDLDESMPPIPIDVNGVHQVLVNLLMNAVEAAPAKKGVVTIKTEYGADTLQARITVSDNGPGIDPSRHQAIFEAFTSFKGQRGTGLGLAVTRKIVAEHGGRIELESAPGEGTSVLVVLPCDRTSSDAGDTRLPRPLAGDVEDPF
ncbi:MAG: FHA domain-containing protein [Phycisphaerales bacterium]|nr:FHA domain-containing protein [Phycisphaerae bacterium]NNF41712.1 FHA domain-containing protein [Phycisphaerales bacterium]NNM25912.1 FHA domain-containing protein [Phycisphaerales bacterium]